MNSDLKHAITEKSREEISGILNSLVDEEICTKDETRFPDESDHASTIIQQDLSLQLNNRE